MKSFSFRLARILKLRETAEQAQARRFGEAARDEMDRDREAAEQAAYLEQVGERLAPPAGHRTSAGLLRVLKLTSEAAASQLADAEQAREAAQVKAETERVELARTRVERKTLERLKEQQYVNWREAADRRDRKEMDEIASRPRGPR
jgi:flagellar export protein FliJ